MTRRGVGKNQIGRVTLAAAMLSGFITACFSDRVTSTEAPAASGECRIPTSSTAAGSVVIFVRDFSFIPRQVTVKRGTRVTWINCENPTTDAHTSTSDTGVWDSPRIAPTEIYSRTFNDAGGVFNYHCVPHPFMQGTITVE